MLLVYLAVAWLAGMVLAKEAGPPWQVLPALGLVSVLGLVLGRRDARVRVGAACLLSLTLGAGRLLVELPRFDETSLATYNDVGRVAVVGVVVQDPDERDTYTNLRLQAEHLTLPDGSGLAVEGLALVRADRYPRRQYGDRVRVEGLLETPPVLDDFSYRDYLARQGVHSLLRRAEVTLLEQNQGSPVRRLLLGFKRYARETISETLPEPQAALLTGILLGVDTGIPRDLMDEFTDTGTTHIIVISGFNLTIVASLFSSVARRLVGRRQSFFIAAAGVAIYTALVGASAAVVRAAVMAFLVLWARYLGRLSSAPVSLGAAAILMTAWNPLWLWDVGLQLSFAATLGLLLYAEPIERRFAEAASRLLSPVWVRRVLGVIGEGLLAAMAATLTITPLILYYFGRLSLVSLASNAVVLPAQPYVMVWGGLATVAGMVVRPLGRVIGWVAWVFLTYTIEAVRLMARVPHASVPAGVSGWLVILYYATLGCLTWWFAQTGERRRELRSTLSSRAWVKALIGAGAVLLVLAIAWWRTLPDGRLHVTLLDVGEGDAIFIETPSGRQMLVDGGPSESVLLDELGRQMPFWDRTLDLVVLTHPDLDHITGLLAVLERYEVGSIVFREMDEASAEYVRWLDLVEAEGAAVHSGEAGLGLQLDEDVAVVVIHPGVELVSGGATPSNNASVVTRLTFGSVAVLLAGDIEARVEGALVAGGAELGSTVLKVAHHGSCTSTTEEFLDAVEPDLALISVGENDFGHPCEGVLERLREWAERRGRDLPVYRTDEHGTVEVITDGAQVWLRTER